jgi:hypothetical protein
MKHGSAMPISSWRNNKFSDTKVVEKVLISATESAFSRKIRRSIFKIKEIPDQRRTKNPVGPNRREGVLGSSRIKLFAIGGANTITTLPRRTIPGVVNFMRAARPEVK